MLPAGFDVPPGAEAEGAIGFISFDATGFGTVCMLIIPPVVGMSPAGGMALLSDDDTMRGPLKLTVSASRSSVVIRAFPREVGDTRSTAIYRDGNDPTLLRVRKLHLFFGMIGGQAGRVEFWIVARKFCQRSSQADGLRDLA